jgi:hypothetical protein
LLACASIGRDESPAIGSPPIVPRREPTCDDRPWRRAVLMRELDAALAALEGRGCSDGAHAMVQATIAAWTGDHERALGILREALPAAPASTGVREAFVALAARMGRCEEAEGAARGLESATGERELLLVALAPRCPAAFPEHPAAVVRRLAGQFPSESTLTMARALFEPGAAPLSPAVELAVHALMARALVPSSVEETELHLAGAERVYAASEWRGVLPSYYAAVARAARVRLETSRFETPAIDATYTPGSFVYRDAVVAGLAAEQTFLCTSPVWVAADPILSQWPDLFARASLDRGRAIERLSAAWDRRAPAPGPARDEVLGALDGSLGRRYHFGAIDAYARAYALRATLGISDAVQDELYGELQRADDTDRAYCQRDILPSQARLPRGELLAEAQPPTNPLEWLPAIPPRALIPPGERATACDFCESRPIPPPRELVSPRTR